MYILVEILHTEFQYISLIEIKSIIEIEKQLKKRNRKECYQPGQKGDFCPGCQTRDKRASRPGVPGWETGTTEISQPGQISVSIVVIEPVLWNMDVLFALIVLVHPMQRMFNYRLHY